MRHIGAARGSAIIASTPLFTLILAVIFLAETPSIPVVVGTVSIVGGLYSLLIEKSDVRLTRKSRILGYSFGLIAALCWGAANILIKQVAQFAHPFVTLSFSLALGILGLSVTTGRDFEIGIKTNKKAISWLLLSGLINGVGVVSYFSALAKAPATIASPLSAMSPLITIACVHLFLQRVERVTRQIVIGVLLVVIGGILVAIYRGL